MTPLRQRFVDDLRLRNYSPRTIEAYTAGVLRLAKHFNRSPELLGTEEIRAFQLHLIHNQVSWSQFNQVVCALPVRARCVRRGQGTSGDERCGAEGEEKFTVGGERQEKGLRGGAFGIHWKRCDNARGHSSSIVDAWGGAVQFNRVLCRMLRPDAHG